MEKYEFDLVSSVPGANVPANPGGLTLPDVSIPIEIPTVAMELVGKLSECYTAYKMAVQREITERELIAANLEIQVASILANKEYLLAELKLRADTRSSLLDMADGVVQSLIERGKPEIAAQFLLDVVQKLA